MVSCSISSCDVTRGNNPNNYTFHRSSETEMKQEPESLESEEPQQAPDKTFGTGTTNCKRKQQWKSDLELQHKARHSPSSVHTGVTLNKLNLKTDLLTGIYVFECDVCTKTFNVKHNFVRHVLAHQRYEKKYLSKGIKQLSSKLDFDEPHTREKIFKCHEFSNTFSLKRYFVKHKKTHFKDTYSPVVSTENTTDKEFTCDICNKTFNLKHKLIKHIQICMYTDSYTCKTCERKFPSKSDIDRHKCSQST